MARWGLYADVEIENEATYRVYTKKTKSEKKYNESYSKIQLKYMRSKFMEDVF